VCVIIEKPTWLPEMIDCNGDINEIFSHLYEIFCRDFKQGPIRLNNLLVWYNRKIGEKGFEEGFWHLIEREEKSQYERYFDPRRAERLPWLRSSIDHYLETEVRFFEYHEFNEVFAYIWLYNFDYVAVFIKRRQNFGDVYFLTSAHYIDGNRKRRQLEKKFHEAVH